MADRKFAHLHLHTHYSLLDGANRVPELVAQTKKLGMTACAITDHGNLYGAVEFYKECKAAGINPVLGYEAYLAPNSRHDKKGGSQKDAYTHLTLLAKNNTGFKNLIKLSSIAFLEGFYYHPRIDREVLAAHAEGLICLSGCLAGEFNQHIVRGKVPEAEKTAKYFHKLFGKDFYIEIQKNGLKIQEDCTPRAKDIANKIGVPLVATADAHYLCADDAEAHDVLFCINTGKKRDPRKRSYPEESMPNPYFVRSPEDMYGLFTDTGEADAVARSQEIADQVHIELDFKTRYFPVFHTPPGKSNEDYLRELCEEALKVRYKEEDWPKARKRLDHELGIIGRMGFASYFLIVWDFVRFAREEGIPCQARGSGCGAIVCYLLYLSHVDPLDYDLLFERFLDPNRSEAPDIDIDFCQDRRESVIRYVKEKYGAESVAQIGTFGTLAAKAALKDVGRVLDIPLDRVNAMCKLVPMKGAISLGLKDALKDSPDFRREYDTDPTVKQWVDIARRLEGMNRGVGTHAAGVVIANGPITNYVPVQRATRKGADGEKSNGETTVTTQWEMGDIEKIGLLKMDFLGLRTLTLIDNTLKLIQKTRAGKGPREGMPLDKSQTLDDLQKLHLDDAKTYDLLQKGVAKGVFQFESDGIRDLLKRMRPDNIRDIVACTALYRPGPLEGGMVDEYIECKHGRKTPDYPHPIMEEVLSETYGVMVYQEQVMRMLNRMGGIELSSAYACIKAISKKKEDIINARKIDFVKGARDQGMAAEKADEIFEQIVKFGGYGFNKSHSAAYAHVTYHTAYLKTYYTAEFMAALLSSEIDDGNKRDMLVDHIADARKLGVDVLPPDVNKGGPDFDVVDGRIVFGLTAIKGLGRGAAEEIVRARTEGGPFKDLFEFCERVDPRSVTKAAVEKLVKAGAMDCFGKGKRAAMFHALPRAAAAAEEKAADRKKGQKNIFDMFGDGGDEQHGEAAAAFSRHEPLPDVAEWPELDRLKFEKEALDFYISSHPLAQFDEQLKRFRTHDAAAVGKAKPSTPVTIAGMVTELIPKVVTKGRNQGNRWAIVRVEDFTGSVKCILWSDQFARFKDDVKADAILLFEGRVEWREGSTEPDLIVEKVLTLDQARKDMTRDMVIRIPYGDDAETLQMVDRIRVLLPKYRGGCPVWLYVRDPAGRIAKLRLSGDYSVDPANVQLDELDRFLGPGRIVFTANK